MEKIVGNFKKLRRTKTKKGKELTASKPPTPLDSNLDENTIKRLNEQGI